MPRAGGQLTLLPRAQPASPLLPPQAASGSSDQNATGTLDVDTERDRDAEALLQKQIAVTKELEARGLVDDQIYRGQAGYTKFVRKEDEERGAKYRYVRRPPRTRRAGPTKASPLAPLPALCALYANVHLRRCTPPPLSPPPLFCLPHSFLPV